MTRQSETSRGKPARANRNVRLAAVLTLVLMAMVGLSFAAVPLYSLFCQVTGYGGTTQVAEAVPEAAGERVIKVRFNADISPDLPWRFQPKQREVEVRVGESKVAYYEAENLSDGFTAGTAVFNVTPLKVGEYFNKIDCFCFTEQALAAGASADMPVSFFIDPAIEEDSSVADVDTITLSYTFFPDPAARKPAPEADGTDNRTGDQTAAAKSASPTDTASLN